MFELVWSYVFWLVSSKIGFLVDSYLFLKDYFYFIVFVRLDINRKFYGEVFFKFLFFIIKIFDYIGKFFLVIISVLECSF